MKGLPSPRMRRVNELLRELVAEEITRLKDPAIGFVTVTGVDTDPDLRHAVVYYSTLGTDEEQQASAGALKRAAPHIQAEIGPQLKIKYLPRLEFKRDPAIERGLRIDALLREIEHDEPHDSGGTDPGG